MTDALAFHLPEGRYFLSHSVGCLPQGARKCLEDYYLTPWANADENTWPAWLKTIDCFREAIGGVIGGVAASICPQPNVSAAFSSYLTSLPNDSRRKIVMHADAFPTMGFVVQGLADRGFELVLIDAGLAADDPGIWADHLTPDVVAAVITHVHSNTGVVSPVDDIAAICRARDISAIVDIAQSVGIVPVDVMNWNADAVVGSCVKWLCGGPGAAYLWVNPDRLDILAPDHIGWFSHADPFEFDIRSFRFADDARKFWGGTPSIAPYATALGSLQVLHEIGFDAIAAHNAAMKTQALDGLPSEQWLTSAPDKSGGTLCLTMPEKLADRAAATFTSAGCHFDRRGSTLRLSFHIYNTADDARHVRETLAGLL